MAKIMGHRGAPADEPENTLRSFRRALAMGVTVVELDVQLTRDRRLAVIHDETLDRTTNGRGPVKDFTLAELQKLDAGQGEPVPSLEEVYELVKDKAHLLVELKQPEGAPALLEFFRRQQAFDAAHAISFWHPAVKALKEAEPRLQTGVLLVGYPGDPGGRTGAPGADALVLNYRYVNRELVDAARRQDIQVMIWNIDDAAILEPYLAMDLYAIGTNRPQEIVNYVKMRNG
jgi:glycerophosphoryl diester phosphodiesterase